MLSLVQSIALLFAASQVGAAPVTDRAAASAPSAQIALGTVIGSSSLGVDSFKGIPYALPPTGNLRLRPPQPVTKPFGTFQATGPYNNCPQFFSGLDKTNIPISVLGLLLQSPLGQTITSSDEDCLNINVQRPSGTTASSSLPVAVYLFGGGFELGWSSMYDGTSIINKSNLLGAPMIFVIMNYRVNGFGFLAGADLAKEGSTNLGLRDQRLALQWVQDNIAAFGGDPTRVTIWGESAGAISVFDHTIINGGDNTYNGKPLFRAGIMSSGSVIPADPVTAPQAQTIYDNVVASAGCSGATDRLACLRSKDYKTFLGAVSNVPGIFSYRALDLSYLPRPDPGDNFFPQSPELALEAKKFAKIPIIIGDQEDEGTLFSLSTPNITTNQQLINYLYSYFPNGETTIDLVTQLVGQYPDDLGISGSPYGTGLLYNFSPQQKRLAAILGDVVFTLSRRVYLTNLAQSGVNTWSYISSYLRGTPVLGTFHGSDILYAFGMVPPNPATNSLQTHFISFINYMDPNEFSAGLTSSLALINWPKWTPMAGGTGSRLMHFLATSNEIITDTFRAKAGQFLFANPSAFRV